jgi:hypothetical protein
MHVDLQQAGNVPGIINRDTPGSRQGCNRRQRIRRLDGL